MKLDAKNVSVSIAGTTIVRNLSIEVPDLKFSALLGANGSGKTTLLRSIYRTQKMDSGIVRLDDKDITHFSDKKLARNMAVMGQFNQINFDYTVLDIALMGRYPFHSGARTGEGLRDSFGCTGQGRHEKLPRPELPVPFGR